MFDLLLLRQLVSQEMPPEYRKQQEVVEAYLHRMSRGFSSAFLDDFWTETGKLFALELDQAFLSGLRLGAELSLALAPQPTRSPRP